METIQASFDRLTRENPIGEAGKGALRHILLSALFSLLLLSGRGRAAITTVTYQVSAGTDDGYAWSATGQDVSSSNLVIGDGAYSAPYHMSGMRFVGVGIPRSVLVISANLRIYAGPDENKGQIYGVLEAEGVDDAADFGFRHIAAATKTSTAVNWDHKFAWDKNSWLISPDISGMVSEVVNRGGWNSGNSLALFYSTRQNSGKKRMFGSYESGFAAALEVRYQTHGIFGQISNSEGAGVEGVVVSAGSEVECTVTDSNGYYELRVPPGWSGVVTPGQMDWGFVPGSRTYSGIAADQIGQDFLVFQPEISGYVRDVDGRGVEEVMVATGDGNISDSTSSNGFYQINVPYEWSGVVIPARAGREFDPVQREYQDVAFSQSDQNYTVVKVYGGGAGTGADPYLIYTAEQLQAVGANPDDWGSQFKLMSDMDLVCFDGQHGRPCFNIIGHSVSNSNPSVVEPFTGVFDGNGHTIYNFRYVSPWRKYTGLFGITSGAQIMRLGLVDPNVSTETGDYVGAMFGLLSGGSASYCYVEGGRVSGRDYVGGFSGHPTNTGVSNCYSTCSAAGNSRVGGLAGRLYNCTIRNSFSTGLVSGNSLVGGLVGDSYVYGDNYSRIYDSFWDMESSGQASSAEGVGKTTEQMQTAGTYIAWACEEVWSIDDEIDYPRFVWQGLSGEAIIPLRFLGGGMGTVQDPYLIYTTEQVNAIGLMSCTWDSRFGLMSDIDFGTDTETLFKVIGTTSRAFTGVFDGNGRVICNLKYSNTNSDRIGMFGYVSGDQAQIRNVVLIDPNINAGWKDYVGALVGYFEGSSIKNCYVIGGRVCGGTNVGGLVGRNGRSTVISDSGAEAAIYGDYYLGGLAGYTDAYSRIERSNSGGTVSGGSYIGGLVGRNNHTSWIEQCYAMAVVEGSGEYLGGLVGYHGRSPYAAIRNCYARGSVSGGAYVGGLVGYNHYSGRIYNSYSTGRVSGTGHIGGLVGENDPPGLILDSFWNTSTSGQSGSDGGVGKTNSQMKRMSTFTAAGWSFVSGTGVGTWRMCRDGITYPLLWWEFAPGDFLCPDGVTFKDYSHFARRWLHRRCMYYNDCDRADLDLSGKVDEGDLKIFCEHWLDDLG